MRIKEERRKCRKFAPLIYFLLEIVAFFEIFYILIAMVGESKYMLAMAGVLFAYLVYRSLARLVYVRNRCKHLEAIEKYYKKSYFKDDYLKQKQYGRTSLRSSRI